MRRSWFSSGRATHRLEVRKEGYRSYAADVAVVAGEPAPINISLPER